MKKVGTYTCRGQITESEIEAGQHGERIVLFDGRWDTGYRVTDFRIWGQNYGGSSNPDVIGKLGTEPDLPEQAADFMNANDVREIAWAASAGATDSGLGFAEAGVIDPDNMIIQDLYIYVRANNDASGVNYMITMDKYEFDDFYGALSMVRNRAQGASNE